MTKLKGKKAAITGKFKSAPRKELKARLEKLGIAVSSSVSKKTDFLVAGAKAGSKMTKAYENSVPILSEGYLNMLLNEEKELDELYALSKTFYDVDYSKEAPTEGVYNYVGGPAPGFGEERWPDKKRHLFSLDLSTMPALQAHYPDFRSVSVFAENDVDMYGIDYAYNATAVLFSTQEQIDEIGVGTHPNALKAYAQKEILITPVEWKTFAELQNHDSFGYTRILGMPCSLQSEMDPSGFIMQGGETLGLSGDGLLYLYADNVTAQVT
ncbi:MAG TPA: hypothetical protein DCE42_20560 [Myxococcales bacterium]|nr:hypothetical protein [Deltaproteobacteria bacterium]HAA57170.1 hypothetical protein [Myxococcales bacterium]|tara:strand:- start:11705 stop:12508 length:804 start_codon:yes stop_codon:yes gene_type:complete